MEKEGKKHPRACSRGGTEPDFLLQWGNRKRLRCVKIQGKGDSTEKTTIRVDRRIVRADKESSPGHNHLLRNSEATGDMKAQNSVHSSSPVNAEERFRPAKANGDNKQSTKDRSGNSGSSGTIQEKKGSSGSEGVTWPKFIIALTSKEKEDDFMAIRGSKPPLRPKKRAKFIQRSLNLVSPGSWLCDLTQERYEVREKKISKKAQSVSHEYLYPHSREGKHSMYKKHIHTGGLSLNYGPFTVDLYFVQIPNSDIFTLYNDKEICPKYRIACTDYMVYELS